MFHPDRSRRRRRSATVLAVASLAFLGAGSLVVADTALADLIEAAPTGAPGRLILASDPYPAQFLDLSPGEPAHWQIRARLEDATHAELALELRKSGALAAAPRGLVMRVDVCDSPWSDVADQPICRSGAREVTVAAPEDDYASSSPTFELRPLTPSAPQYLLVTLAVDSTGEAARDASLMDLRGNVAVGLTATSIEDDSARPAERLAVTGAAPEMLLGVGALAVGVLGLGAALRRARKGGAA